MRGGRKHAARIHPDDAEAIGLEDGARCRISSAHGEIEIEALGHRRGQAPGPSPCPMAGATSGGWQRRRPRRAARTSTCSPPRTPRDLERLAGMAHLNGIPIRRRGRRGGARGASAPRPSRHRSPDRRRRRRELGRRRWPVLYDADCGFCKWSLDKLLAWDRRQRLRPVAIQSAEGERCSRRCPRTSGSPPGTSCCRPARSGRAEPPAAPLAGSSPAAGRSRRCSTGSRGSPSGPTAGSPTTAARLARLVSARPDQRLRR